MRSIITFSLISGLGSTGPGGYLPERPKQVIGIRFFHYNRTLGLIVEQSFTEYGVNVGEAPLGTKLSMLTAGHLHLQFRLAALKWLRALRKFYAYIMLYLKTRSSSENYSFYS